MGPEGIILVNPPITTLQQSLTHSALVAFVRLYSTVLFQMIPQIACMRRRIVTLDGWMDLFDFKTLSVFFQDF